MGPRCIYTCLAEAVLTFIYNLCMFEHKQEETRTTMYICNCKCSTFKHLVRKICNVYTVGGGPARNGIKASLLVHTEFVETKKS